MICGDIWTRFTKFAYERGLYFGRENEGSVHHLVFGDHIRDIEHEYVLTHSMMMNKTGDAIYDEITDQVMRDFAFDYVKDPVAVAQVDEVKYDTIQATICGLSKNEYIALELTKAWASAPKISASVGSIEIMDVYKEFLEKLDKEGK